MHDGKNELIAFFPDQFAKMLYVEGSPPGLLCTEVLMGEGTAGSDSGPGSHRLPAGLGQGLGLQRLGLEFVFLHAIRLLENEGSKWENVEQWTCTMYSSHLSNYHLSTPAPTWLPGCTGL